MRPKYSRYGVDDSSLEICEKCNRVSRKSESIALADNCCEEFLIGGLELISTVDSDSDSDIIVLL